MEIYFNNLFLLAVKLPWWPCMNFSKYMTHKCLTISSHGIYILLEKPLLSTILCSLFIVIFFITLFVSFVIITITLCCILIIIVVEGAIIIVSSVFITTIVAIVTLIYVMLTGMKIEIEHIKQNITE